MSPQITIYTTPDCSFCRSAKGFFKSHNIPFEEKDITTDNRALEEMLRQSGQLGVPVIDVGGTIVVGFDERRLKKLVDI